MHEKALHWVSLEGLYKTLSQNRNDLTKLTSNQKCFVKALPNVKDF